MVSGPNRVPGPNSVGLGYIKQALGPNTGGNVKTHTHTFTHTHSYTLTHSHIHSHTFTHTHTCPAVSVTQHLSTRSIQTAQACTKAVVTLTLM